MTNAILREHVTSIGFSLTLSKMQIETLVLMHYHGEWNKFWAHKEKSGFLKNYCTTARALGDRGLIRRSGPGIPYQECELCDDRFCGHQLTKAGVLAAELLKEAGIYQDVLERHRVEPKGDAA